MNENVQQQMIDVNWKVEGMHCTNCALSITRYLQKEGMRDVLVNAITGDVAFKKTPVTVSEEQVKKGIEELGYSVQKDALVTAKVAKSGMNSYLRYFLMCLPFTLLLMLHMFNKWWHVHWLMNPWVQLALCLPVFIIGLRYFGKSAWLSLRKGIPNMNVLITLGAMAAFGYSLAGKLLQLGHVYLFYETTATIFTLVFFGNYLEDVSISRTQGALNKLVKHQKIMANMIAFDDQHQELIFPLENTQLKSGDLILIKSGEQVPADCKILWGEVSVNEAVITGESLPISKKPKDVLMGGSLIADGSVKAQVTAGANDSVLANIINLVKRAQGDKPPVQQLADRISAVFVPIVLGVALVTFIANYLYLKELTPSTMRSIAVLVIACPCAMGLATPAAIAVGLGRAARQGILFRNAKSLEAFKTIRQVVFDKTGTLTTGNFVIQQFSIIAGNSTEESFKQMVFSLEKYSNHPIAKCITIAWKKPTVLLWQKIEEIKGLGMKGVTKEGDIYIAGSFSAAKDLTADDTHSIYVIKNNILLGWIDVSDELRPEAKTVIQYLKQKGIKTILLSGDRKRKCEAVATELQLDEVLAEQSPEQKLLAIEAFTKQQPTAMVGDGINDAPALAKATLGIAMNDASQLAMQTANIVLMNHGLNKLPEALGLGKHTLITIRQNLFWAFIYNIVAIPVAAFGFLTPAFGALVMGLSDVVLAINSGRLFVKKVV
jgi:Cu+-exporting ATPase